MAKNNSIVTGKLSGSLGKELVFRDWAGKTIVAKSPKRNRRVSDPSQEARQEKFLFASKYAKGIMDDPDQSLAEAYAAALRPRQNVYSRALEDAISPPVVKSIDVRSYKGAIGDKIRVRAVDDFRVTKVIVDVFATDGSLLESGEANQEKNVLDWSYTTTKDNSTLPGTKIKATAFDIPDNNGMLEVTL